MIAFDLKFLFKNRKKGKFYFGKVCFRCLLQARLRKLRCKNFQILETQNFQNSLKIKVFILDTNIQRKSFFKLHQKIG
jgi:hypothetical protein